MGAISVIKTCTMSENPITTSHSMYLLGSSISASGNNHGLIHVHASLKVIYKKLKLPVADTASANSDDIALTNLLWLP